MGFLDNLKRSVTETSTAMSEKISKGVSDASKTAYGLSEAIAKNAKGMSDAMSSTTKAVSQNLSSATTEFTDNVKAGFADISEHASTVTSNVSAKFTSVSDNIIKLGDIKIREMLRGIDFEKMEDAIAEYHLKTGKDVAPLTNFISKLKDYIGDINKE